MLLDLSSDTIDLWISRPYSDLEIVPLNMAQEIPIVPDKQSVNGDIKAVDSDKRATKIEVPTDVKDVKDVQQWQAVKNEVDEFENAIEARIAAAREDPSEANLKALQDAAVALNEIDQEIDKLDTTNLEQRMKALSEPGAFTQTGNDAYSIEESLALDEEFEEVELSIADPAASGSAAGAAEPKDESKQAEVSREESPVQTTLTLSRKLNHPSYKVNPLRRCQLLLQRLKVTPLIRKKRPSQSMCVIMSASTIDQF